MINRNGSPKLQREDLPLAPLDYTPIFSPKPGQEFRLVALDHRPVGIWTHFYLNRTIACVGKDTGCICQFVQVPRRWKGYIASWEPKLDRVCLGEVTVDAMRQHGGFYQDANLSILHREYILFRLGGRKNSPVRISIGKPYDLPDALPACPDVIRCLCRIWGVAYIAEENF